MDDTTIPTTPVAVEENTEATVAPVAETTPEVVAPVAEDASVTATDTEEVIPAVVI